MDQVIRGNLTADPETRTTPTGRRVTQATVAWNDSYESRGETVQVPPVFFKVEAWGEMSDALAQGSRGSAVLVVGPPRRDEWTDKESGEKRSRNYVQADAVRVFARRADHVDQAQQQEASATGDEWADAK